MTDMTRHNRRHAVFAGALAAAGILVIGHGSAAATPVSPSDSASSAKASCTRITDHRTIVTGLPNVHNYNTHIATVKNSCSTKRSVSVDVARWPDPPCKTIKANGTEKFTWSVSTSYPPQIIGAPRGVKSC